MNTCSWIMDDETECGEICEGKTTFCGSHNRQLRREEQEEKKQASKRKPISKNPKDWGNTFLCSDGNRVKQSTIDSYYKQSKVAKYGAKEIRECEGCGTLCNSNAHIISKARCKQIGKTELIWNHQNYFASCYKCNSAIENPKGNDWKQLKNIEKCLSFIKQHDQELYTKFELSATTEPHKI